MTGKIKTFLPDKKYGFIKGDDGKDYFFHSDEFKKEERNNLIENKLVDFDTSANAKGYKALKCILLDNSKIETYNVPNTVMTSKNNTIKDYDILESCKWELIGSSRNSPDFAKQELINSAKQVGANALLNMTYVKTTGSEAGTGNGTHYFTIHNYIADIAVIGKLSLNGEYKREDILNLNEECEEISRKIEQDYQGNVMTFTVFMILFIAGILTFITTHPEPIFYIFSGIGFLFVSGFSYGILRNSYKGNWIRRK